MTSAYAQNYIYNNLGPYYGAVALSGGTENIPSPFEDVARGYFLYGSGARGLLPDGNVVPEPTQEEGKDVVDADSTPSTTSKLTGILGQAQDYVKSKVEDFMAIPEAVNPLTGTVRATGVSKAIGSMMPDFFGSFAQAAGKANMENMYRLAGKAQTNAGYSTGLINNQLVGVQPTSSTFAGKVLDAFGIASDGYALTGTPGSFPNVDQDAYEDALTTSLLYSGNRPVAYSPARSLAMGLQPGDLGYMDATYSQTEHKYNVATLLGIDTFGPNPGLSTSSAFQDFAKNNSPNSLGPSIVGSYDAQGNWAPVTNRYSGYVFGNTKPGTTKAALEEAGFAFFERPYGQFEVYSPDIGFGPGGGIGSPFDNTADSQANQGSGATPSGPSFDDSSLGKGGGGGGGGGGDYGGMGDISAFRSGGRVGYATGTPKVTQGFINKDPDSVTDEQSIADNRYTSVPEGTMIMNQPSNDNNEKQLDKLVAEAKRNVKLSDKRPKMVDVALSDGERSIHPEYVAYIEKKKGKGYLEKLNNQGKAEVSRRQAKYGEKIGAANGGIQTDRGFVQQTIRPDVPTLTGPPSQQGFLDLPSISPDDDMFFGRRFGDIVSAIQNVEIKGFEDNPYIFTGIKRKGKASSAFGPMQITASTLKDIKTRSSMYKMLEPEAKQYMDLLIQQGDDKVNIEKYGSMYRDGKKIITPKNTKKLYGRYSTGEIPPELHEQFYKSIAGITLRQKLKDHKSLAKALASYGEGENYAKKVLSGLN